MYPATSSFRSAERLSAWVGLGPRAAATQGYSFVRLAQLNLRATLGTMARDVAVDGIIGPRTMRALANFAQNHGATPEDLAALRNVDATGLVDRTTVAWMALVGVLLAQGVGVGADQTVYVPDDAVLPLYRIAPPVDAPEDRDRAVIYTPSDGVPTAAQTAAAAQGAADGTVPVVNIQAADGASAATVSVDAPSGGGTATVVTATPAAVAQYGGGGGGGGAAVGGLILFGVVGAAAVAALRTRKERVPT